MNMVIVWLIGFAMVSVAIVVQFNTYLNVDLALHIEIVRRMLDGEVLYRDIFEVNPPLIIYYTFPAVYLSQLFDIPAHILLNAANFIVCTISAFVAWIVIRETEEYQNRYFQASFILALCYSIFLLPLSLGMTDFGEKDHIFIVLFLPYLFLYLWSDSQRKSHPILICLIGLMAAIGLCIKPYFFIIPLVLEIHNMVKKRQFFACVRRENIIIAIFALSFLIMIILCLPEYVSHVIPFAKLAYPAVASDMGEWHVILTPAFIFFAIPLIFILPYQDSSRYKTMLIVALLGAIMEYLLQYGKWNYVFLPVTTIGIFLGFASLGIVVEKLTAIASIKKRQFTYANSHTLISGCFYLILIIATPIAMISTKGMRQYIDDQYNTPELLRMIKKYEQYGDILFLTQVMRPAFPLTAYSSLRWHGEMNSMFLLDGIYSYRRTHPNSNKESELAIIEQYLKQDIVNVIIKYAPPAIIVYQGIDVQDLVKNQFYTIVDVNYIESLSQNQQFKKLWENYQFSHRFFLLHEYPGNAYRGPVFAVYVRKDLL